ncbi:hypothetical protein E2F50_20170 [Rhizobium deserti]|uniref:Uncharacterized protein n=2 Tax=Rhizobium deserti TaxID=2547961 RepID=A0A4R5U9W3_9HYPH|nr:hypothetical protein E2F50_20170 [Rhizobium deserti]
MLPNSSIHVFTALFESSEEAFAFAHPHWEPEPGDDASDEEYAAWEDRNPVWPMKVELGYRIESDFVGVVWSRGDQPDWQYLASRLNAAQVAAIMGQTTSANCLVLIDQAAIKDERVEFKPTGSLTYHGSFISS